MSQNKNNHEKEIIQNLKNMKPQKKKGSSLHNFQHTPKEKVLVAWEAMEKEHYERGSKWYVGLFIFTLVTVLYGVFTKSWTTIVAFLLMPVAIILYSSSAPKRNEIFITEKGIYINKKSYRYKEMSDFWVFDDDEHPVHKLGFRNKGMLQVETEVLLHDLDTDMIRSILGKFVKEDKKHIEHLSSHLIRIFKL